jgi:hypothetical protein
MRDHLHFASARRDDRLARIRKLTLWVGGSAAAASLGLGAVFAHALPGHSATSATTSRAKAPAGADSAGASGGPSSGTSAPAGARKPRHHHHQALAQPQQQPAPTQAAPVVSSGGS